MSDSTRWRTLRDAFDAVVDLDPGAQAQRLSALLPNDSALRGEVLALLSAARDAGERFDHAPRLPDEGSGEPQVPSLVGRSVGPYRMTRRIGQGGMGAVYEAERVDGHVRHRVAIKSVWRGADSEVLTRRFRSERQILAGLQHPNIAQFLDAGATAEGLPYLVMEFVEGLPIDQHCDQRQLGIPERLALFLAVCAAVQHAHRHLVVHRDLKPSNVMVTRDGQAKLLDFGVAKLLDDPRDEGTLTGAGLSPFTAAFAAPEQVTGSGVSTATDVYALGALLTVLLAGRAPHDVAQLTPGSMLATIRDKPAEAPSELARAADDSPGDTHATRRGFSDGRHLSRVLSGELDAITLMALRKEPSRRYATVDALAADITRYLKKERVLARPDTIGYRVQAFVRRNRPLVAGITIAVVALAGGTTFSVLKARESRASAARSERVAAFLARVTTADAGTVDPIARLGSRVTLAQLLDSLLKRVPVEFADDVRIRARLYASIGTNYRAQGRLREAERVLDSAVTLSKVAYGEKSDEFVAASIEMTRTINYRTSPAEAERHVRNAFAALAGREQSRPDLYALTVVSLAEVRNTMGAVREADSLSREVVRLELQRTPAPTLTRTSALMILANTTAWITRDPRIVDTMYVHAVAIMDSLGGRFSFERLTAIDGRLDALTTLGRYDEAESQLREALAVSVEGYGSHSREAALFLARGASLARAQGDAARSLLLADSAWRVMESNADLSAWIIAEVGTSRIASEWASGRLHIADSIAALTLQRTLALQVPSATILTAFYAGMAAIQVKDWPRAEAQLRRALGALPATGDLDSMIDRVRRPLVQALAGQGRQPEADSVEALIASQPPTVRCRPGGDWRGC